MTEEDYQRLADIRHNYTMLEWSGDVGDDVVFLLRLLDERVATDAPKSGEG